MKMRALHPADLFPHTHSLGSPVVVGAGRIEESGEDDEKQKNPCERPAGQHVWNLWTG